MNNFALIIKQKLCINKLLLHFIPIIFVSLAYVLLLNNILQKNITNYHSDEVHTMNLGVNSLYSGEVTLLRVGESTRWLARAIYPFAQYYMNSQMGGEHYVTGWSYAGGFYIQKYFKNPQSIKYDPNLQDFTFAMKFMLGLLVIFSFLLSSFFILKEYGFIASFSYLSLSLSSPLIIGMLSIFYTESTLIILFNLLIVLALATNLNKWRFYIYSALILSFAISTKLTGVIFTLPIAVLIILKDENCFKNMKLEGFIILTVILLAVINIPASSYMSLIDQTLMNVYHLKTGHLVTEPSGMYQLRNILNTLTPWGYIFFVSFFSLSLLKIKNKVFIVTCAVVSCLMVISLINVNFYLERNLTTPLIIMFFVLSITLSKLLESNPFAPKTIASVYVVLLMLLLGLSFNNNYFPITKNSIYEIASQCRNVAVVGMDSFGMKTEKKVSDMPDRFIFMNDEKKLKEQFLPYECVAVKRINNNKHYTNYILPKGYSLAARIGDYFLFKKYSPL